MSGISTSNQFAILDTTRGTKLDCFKTLQALCRQPA